MQLAKWIPLANANSYAPIHATNIMLLTLDRSTYMGLWIVIEWLWHKLNITLIIVKIFLNKELRYLLMTTSS